MKSGVIYGKQVGGDLKRRITRALGMQERVNPGKYPGLATELGRSRSAALSWIQERIMRKIDGWKENLLN